MLKIKNILQGLNFLFLGGVMACLALPSCTDDKILLEDDPANPDNIEVNGDAIAFRIELDKSITSRAGLFNSSAEDKDDWIDMQDKFRVFFFTADGDFLFGANDRIVGSIENTPGTTAKGYWYVRIPMTMIVDRNNQEYDMAKIKRYLKTHPFKIAVLANWPNAGDKINPSDYDDSADNNFKQNPSSSLKGEPLWSWENSVLNENATDIKNINDLHHIYNDTYYASTIKNTGGTSNYEVYRPFMNEYYPNRETVPYLGMGQPTDWVKMRDIKEGWAPKGPVEGLDGVPAESFDSKETANQWIRAYWNPNTDLNNDKLIYRHYQHLWFLWNFNAIYNVGEVVYDTSKKPEEKKEAKQYFFGGNYNWNDGRTIGRTTNKWGEQWWDRNGEKLYNDWLKGNLDKPLKSYTLNVGGVNNAAYLQFVEPKDGQALLKHVKTTAGNDSYGIMLPKMTDRESEDLANVKDGSSGYFKFVARTSGTLRIRWGSADNDEATLIVQTDQTKAGEFKVAKNNINRVFDTRGSEGGLNYLDIAVNDNSKEVFIWCKEGNAIIYAIEYIRGKYLYDTDREGIVPNEDQGIPMYGVRQYPAIPEWEYGTTHNLQGEVSLIRALAKVVLYIPQKYGAPPKHVYMRCMNRTAHCEPMDVETNTSDLWSSKSHNFNNGETGDVNCEWYNIQKYAPAYNTEERGVNLYQNYLSWFYGSWKNAKWFPDGYLPSVKDDTDSEDNEKEDNEKKDNPTQGKTLQGRYYDSAHGHYKADSYKGWPYNFVSDNITGSKKVEGRGEDHYPHLFNPHINRSEFCSFIYMGEDPRHNYAYKYVLYVPDKFIDDPYYAGVRSSTPKVPHIEFRFAPEEQTSSVANPVEANISNTEFNLDDNDCYRIYFTNYGYDSSFTETQINDAIRTVSASSYDNYEKDQNHLKLHWPIMRNHVYEFTVSDAGPTSMKVNVRVMDWSHEKVIVDW